MSAGPNKNNIERLRDDYKCHIYCSTQKVIKNCDVAIQNDSLNKRNIVYSIVQSLLFFVSVIQYVLWLLFLMFNLRSKKCFVVINDKCSWNASIWSFILLDYLYYKRFSDENIKALWALKGGERRTSLLYE